MSQALQRPQQDTWNASVYGQFLEARTRPARDLLFAISPDFHPKAVCDLGCGPGNSTILLQERWPEATVVGMDTSSSMLVEAKKKYPDIEFIQGDIATWAPEEKIDCLFANAALQWVSNHETLFPKLTSYLRPGGIFAMQIPNNFHTPSHQTTVRLLQTHSEWHPFLSGVRYGLLETPFYTAATYYDLGVKAGLTNLLLWETEYFQEMQDHQSIFNWVKGTGLQPVLSQMDSDTKSKFERAYVEAIRSEYPIQRNGNVLLPFRRLFLVGCRPSS